MKKMKIENLEELEDAIIHEVKICNDIEPTNIKFDRVNDVLIVRSEGYKHIFQVNLEFLDYETL